MSNLYNVQLKIGKRSINTEFFATDYNSIIDFVNQNLTAKVVKIQHIVYDNRDSNSIPVDDKTTYKGTMYFLVRNNSSNMISRIVVPTVKNSKSSTEVFQSIKSLLKMTKTHKIDSMVSVKVSSK